MPYASCLAPHCCLECSSGQPACPGVFSLKEPCLSEDLSFCNLFYAVHICSALWDNLSGLCVSWDSLSNFPDHLLGSGILVWSVWPVIGYPL